LVFAVFGPEVLHCRRRQVVTKPVKVQLHAANKPGFVRESGPEKKKGQGKVKLW